MYASTQHSGHPAFQRYPTATITELPAEGDTSTASAAVTVEEETVVVEGEDFLSPADYVGGENYLANVAQVRLISSGVVDTVQSA